MNIAHRAQRQSRAIIFLILVLSLLGAATLLRLPVLLFPQVSFPRVRIALDAGNRPAERMLIEVTRPVEEAVRGIPGVRGVRSVTSRGSADADVDFDWGHDMIAAELQVNAQLNRIASALPSGTHFDVHRMDPTVFPVIAYSLTSDSHSLVELRDLAQYQLSPGLSSVTGVAKVGVQGGETEEWRVVVDQGKLQSFNLTLAEVAKALSASNVLTSVGRLQQYDKLYLVVSDTRFKTMDEVSQSIIRSGADGVVRVDDIAVVRPDPKPQYVRVTADGKQAVLFSIYQQPGGNTVQIAKDIKAKLKEEAASLAELKNGSIKLANWYDQSGLIVNSEGSVRDAIGIGVVLAAIILFAFLRNWKITLIATMAVPVTLSITLLLLYVMNMSLNIMTLGGMAAAVGLIIDDAIVMVEHVMRRLREAQGEHRDRVVNAAIELTTPLAGSSASTIIIFAPLALLSGVTGAFFKALSLTMAASLVVSFLVAWLAVPILSAHFLSQKDVDTKESGAWMQRLTSMYERFMRRLLGRSWLVLLFALPLFGVGWIAFGHVQSGFMPAMDEGGFILDYNAPPSTSLPETGRELQQVEAILRANPAVETYSRRTGLQLGGAVTEANQGDFFVRLKPFPRPPIDEVMSEVRQRIGATIPALKIETSQLMEDLIGDLTGVPQPVDIKLFAPDEKTLLQVAPRVANAVGQLAGIVEVKDGIVPAGDALNIEVDRAKASLQGVDPESVTQLLNDYLSGTVTTSVRSGPKLVDVRVWVAKDLWGTKRDIENLPLRAPDGHWFPLKRVASLTVVTGQPQIDRENLKRMAAVTARIEGRDLGSTMADVTKALNRSGLLPAGVTFELGGTYQQQRQSFQGLLLVMIAALVLVFALLLFLYRRFLVALAMLSVVLMAICVILLALWLTGTELDIMSIMGMTMIVGIVTEVSIFYYSEYAEFPTKLSASDRLIATGTHRARAIAMTTIAAILALSTLALGIGQGSAMLQPLAIAIIAGLCAQLPLVLFVLPALLVLFRSVNANAKAPK